MVLHLIENLTGNDCNMSRVRIEQNFEVICLNESSGKSSACDRSAQGINLSTPIIMTTFGVLGNVLALIVLYASRREAHARRTVFFVMLSGLAWTDLIGLLSVSPIAIITYANKLQWVGGPHLCRYHGFMMVSFGVVMPLIVCCMSVERFLAIKFSYYYARHITRKKAQLTFLACWCVTLSFTALPFVGFGSYEHQFPGSWCFLNFHKESEEDIIYAAMFSCLNIIAILIMIFCNLMVAWTLLRMRLSRQLHSSSSVDRRLSISGVGSTTSGTVIRPRHHSDMEAQMIWFLGLITIAFGVCWLPLNVHILIMQFTGNKNFGLDLQFIRMVSCNQILDPWLYVIFRKNSLLRIIRRFKACYSVNKEPPRNFPVRPPGMRYVLGNKSFICEATTVGRTFIGQHRDKMSPILCKHLITNFEQMKRQSICSGDSSDSVASLIPVCSYCDDENSCQMSSNPLAELTPNLSVSVLRVQRLSYDSSTNVQSFDNRQLKTEISNLKSTVCGTSEPVLDIINSKRTLHRPSKNLSNELNGIYYSLDSTHHPSTTSSNNSHIQRDKVITATQKVPLLKSINFSNSSKMTVSLLEAKPPSMNQSLTPHLLLYPPLASPELLLDTASTVDRQDSLSVTQEKVCLSYINIPSKTDDARGSHLLKSNGHITTNSGSLSSEDKEHLTSNSCFISTDGNTQPLKNLIENVHVPNNENTYLYNHDSPVADALTKDKHTEHHTHKLSNGASTDYLKDKSHCLLTPRTTPSPHKVKPSTFPGKFCPLISASKVNQSHKHSVSDVEAKLNSSVCHLQTTDHTDHIKCFKAKKTLFLDRNDIPIRH